LAPVAKRKQPSGLEVFHGGTTKVPLNRFLEAVNSLSIKKKRRLIKKTSLLEQTYSSAGAWLWAQLGPMVGAVMSPMVNKRGCLGYPVASSAREDDIM
jgi:hypothetical protein